MATPSNRFFSTGTENGATVLTMNVDRIDLAVADELKHDMRSTVAGLAGPVVIDMSAVSFIDSSGLGAFVSMRKHAGEGRDIGMRNTTPFVTKVLRLTQLDRIFVN